MMTEEKRTITAGERIHATNMLMNFIRACPQIVRPGTGLEEFVEDLNRAALKYAEYNPPPKSSDRQDVSGI